MQINEKVEVIETRTYTLQLSEREMQMLLHMGYVSVDSNELGKFFYDLWYNSPVDLRINLEKKSKNFEEIQKVIRTNAWKSEGC